MGVNTTEVTKKDKDKDKIKDLSHIECYTCKQKGHYANMCSNFDSFYINNWENGRFGIGTLYLVSYYFQRLNGDPTRLKKQCQCNKLGFRFLTSS